MTERRRYEQQRQDALNFADSIIATLREPFVVLDKSLRIKMANRSFYETFHTNKDETESRSIFDLGNGQWNIPRLRMMLDEVLSNNHPVQDFDVEHDFPVIGRRVMLLNASRFLPVIDQAELILLAIEDITERNQADAAVRISELRYRRLFETARDGILILDADTRRIIDVNPFMTDLLGYAADEFRGKELWELGLFKDKQASKGLFQELQETGYVRYDHLPLETKKGEKAHVEFISNLYRVDRQLIAQCNIRDVSERTRLERKMLEQTEALADLHRRKDEFLAMLSHELRNPLAPIANAVHILRLQKPEDQFQQQAATIIERQVAQLTRLVDDLMEVSRITTGRVQLRLERIAVAGIVERAAETIRPIMEQHGQELTLSVPPEPIWLYADATRLEQVMINLLANASKYSDDRGRIFVTVEQQGDECALRVRDTGIGISPEILPRVFELFTQAERSLDRSEGGLGIGLALVQRLVEMHRGRVDVVSALGQGSEFTVYLPVMLTPASPPPITTETTKATARSLRILVVDDNVDSVQSLAMLLQTLRHDVRAARDGPAALEAAREFRPDVVLLDIGLPRMDGYEVARNLRQEPGLKNVVLVALTGYGLDSDRRHAQEAGFDHHLAKPGRLEQLEQIFATVAERVT